jgi:thiamine pyrophosphate-dependent acetolactate synthase large subunit-like protein
MQLDRIDGEPDERVAWGSDVAAQMLRRLGVPYISLNPGASYRGLHDSIVNHLGNERPGILLCLHEDHSVAIAHGYAKATGEPMACVMHSNVGLLHGMMSLFNAWCDRVPMIVLGATGPLDAEKRRPWIDWIHTSRDQGAYIRSIIKWDDQPSSPQALVESMCRAHIATRTAPTAPVYICLDAGLQESRLDKPPEWPDVSRFSPAEPPRPARGAVDRAAALLARAERPVIMFGRGSRQREFWQPRVRLAEALGACVVSDLKQGAVFPTDHPAHHLPPFNVLPKGARELLCEADAILALDWVDLGGALRQAKTVGKVTAKIVAATLDQNLHTGANMEYQALAAVDVAMAATGDAVVEDLLAALGSDRRREPWKARPPTKIKTSNGPGITMEHIAATLRAEFNDPENVTFCTLGRGWPVDIWPFQDGLAYLGKDGGGGLGSGPGLSVGAALALHGLGRHPIAMLGDGDFCMGDRDLDRGAPSHPAARARQQQPLVFQRRAAPGHGGAHTRAQRRQPLDRIAHGGSRARHRQARRGARRRWRGAGAHRRRGRGGNLARGGGAQVGRRLRDRFSRRSAAGAFGWHRSPRDRRLTRAALVTPRDR